MSISHWGMFFGVWRIEEKQLPDGRIISVPGQYERVHPDQLGPWLA